jgi:hypothetical protein
MGVVGEVGYESGMAGHDTPPVVIYLARCGCAAFPVC